MSTNILFVSKGFTRTGNRNLVRIAVLLCLGLGVLGDSGICFTRADCAAHARAEEPSPRVPLSFVDVTEAVGLPSHHLALWGANWFDSDQDGWLDLHLNGHFQPPLFFAYSGDQSFFDVSYRFPTDKPPPQDRHSFLFGDFVRNGLPDLFIVHGGGIKNYPDGSQWNELLVYDSETDAYVDVIEGTGLEDPFGRGRGAALFDYNGDGVTDLYLLNTSAKPEEPPHRAFLGDLLGGFTRDPGSGLEFAIRTWGGPLPCDYDNDGDTDVFVRLGARLSVGRNALLRNEGGVFTDVAEAAGLAGTQNNQGAAWGDYDNDGWMDLVVAHEHMPPGATLALYHNQQNGTFVEVTDAGLNHMGTFAEVAWADFDNDGYLDLYVGGSHLVGGLARNLLYHNLGDGTFEEVGVSAGVPATVGGINRVVAVADYDRDGLMDIFTGVGFFRKASEPDERLYLYRNVTPTTNQYLEIELRGPVGNELAIGTRVEVRTNITQVRQQYGGVSHHSQDSPIIHFGMGTRTRARVTVRWPNGRESIYCTKSNLHRVFSFYDGPPILTDGPLVGAVTDNSARVFARTSSAGTVQVRYSTSADLSDAGETDPVMTAEEEDFTTTIELTGLPPLTEIYYQVLVEGVDQFEAPFPSFVTFPDSAASFSVGLLADLCNTWYELAAPAYAALAAAGPDFVIQLGDFDHRGPGGQMPCRREMHRDVRSKDNPSGLAFDTYIAPRFPFFHIWDDHDFGANNADKTFPAKAEALQAFQEYYPTPLLANPEAGIWHNFRYGQAEFFMLDCRSNRDAAGDPDGPDKSMLNGDDIPNGQKEWLLQGLLQSTAVWKFIISGVPFNPTCKPPDSWGAYPTERQEILDFIDEHEIGGVIVISGDAHTGGAIDDGTNAGVPELSVPHTNLPTGSPASGSCPSVFWTEGRIPGADNPGYGLIRVETNPDRVWLETYGENGTLRQSLLIELASVCPDIAEFVDCLTGPVAAVLPGCEPCDLVPDDHVDLRDFAQFQQMFCPGVVAPCLVQTLLERQLVVCVRHVLRIPGEVDLIEFQEAGVCLQRPINRGVQRTAESPLGGGTEHLKADWGP